jgi:hypothetical protein
MLRAVLAVCFVCVLLASRSAATAACVDRDCFASVPQLVKENGYPVESHDVVTSDGYILTMHRIPRPGSPVVLLQHGLLDASETWVINSANNSLGFLLHDAGYDVFLVRRSALLKHECIHARTKLQYKFTAARYFFPPSSHCCFAE